MNKLFKVVLNRPIVQWVEPTALEINLDNNYYLPKYLETREILLNSGLEIKTLSTLVNNDGFITGSTPDYKEEEIKEGAVLLKTVNVERNELNTSKLFYINKENHQKLKRSQLNKGDLVITVIGATDEVIGRTIVYDGRFKNANITQSLAKFRVRETYDEFFVSTFLNSKYGHNLILQMSSSSTRRYVNNTELGQILVPIPSIEIQKYIGNKVRKAEELREEAKRLKSRAKEIMYNEILQISKDELVIEERLFKWVKNGFIDPLRLDAEYYKDKFLKAEEIIKRHKHTTLGELAEEIQDGPGGWAISTNDYTNEGIPVIRGVNISEDGEFINEGFVYISKEKNNDLRKTQVTPGQVLLSVRGTIGKSTVLPDYIPIANLNAAVVRIKLKENSIDPYYLSGFLNSEIGRLQTSRIANGAVQQNMNLTECKSILIPIPSIELQKKYREVFVKYIKKLDLSKKLIFEAKQDVEDLIEGKFDESKISEGV
ncbi:restriction endonuclease subunit S [Aeribacillus sp. SP014]